MRLNVSLMVQLILSKDHLGRQQFDDETMVNDIKCPSFYAVIKVDTQNSCNNNKI